MELEGFVDVTMLLHAAIYALVREGRVVYVGQSKLPLLRINQHRGGWGKKKAFVGGKVREVKSMLFDAIWIMPCPWHKLDEVEIEMIKRYQPRYNIRHMPRQPSPDISALLVELMPFVAERDPEPRIRRRI
jgi:hypothetical protein